MVASILQSATNANTGSTVTATLASTPTLGNTLVVLANSDATISLSGTWSERFHYLSDQDFYIWSRDVVASDTTTFTITPSVSDYVSIVVLELAGVSSTPFDVVGTVANNTNSTSLAASSITTTADNDIVLVAHAQHGYSGTVSSGPSWNNSFTTAASAFPPAGSSGAKTAMIVGQKIQATAGAVGATTASWTNQAQNVAAVQISFKASTGSNTVNGVVASGTGVVRAPVVSGSSSVGGTGMMSGTGTVIAPSLLSSSNVNGVVASGSGVVISPALNVSSNVSSVVGYGIGAIIAPSLIVSSNISGVVFDGTGVINAHNVNSSSSIAPVVSNGVGDLLTPSIVTDAVVNATRILGSGSLCAPTLPSKPYRDLKLRVRPVGSRFSVTPDDVE